MNTGELLVTQGIVEKLEDLRDLFSVDSQFVNMDDTYEDCYGEGEVCPFDNFLNEVKDKDLNLSAIVYELGVKLLEFDSEFIDFKYEILDVDEHSVVSVAFLFLPQ